MEVERNVVRRHASEGGPSSTSGMSLRQCGRSFDISNGCWLQVERGDFDRGMMISCDEDCYGGRVVFIYRVPFYPR